VSLKNIVRILHLLGKDLVFEVKTIKGKESNVIWADFSHSQPNFRIEDPVFESKGTEWNNISVGVAK
jgi:hypothetical protein